MSLFALSAAVTAGFLTLFGFIFVMTQYFEFIKAYSAYEAGVRLLPLAVSTIAAGSVIAPRIVERIGTTAVVVAGLAIFAAGLAWASTAAFLYGLQIGFVCAGIAIGSALLVAALLPTQARQSALCTAASATTQPQATPIDQ
jgi:hypothetical protein